jgi:hypothetical protein
VKPGEGGLWVLGIIGAVLLLIGLYFHTERLHDCDEKGGELVKSGTTTICVKEVK